MPDQTERHAGDDGGAAAARSETSYDSYRMARERFFARLLADAEVGRLERWWRQPAAEPDDDVAR